MSRDMTPRMRDVCDLLSAGKRNKEIARHLGLGEGTVKVHVNRCFTFANVRNRTELALWWRSRSNGAVA